MQDLTQAATILDKHLYTIEQRGDHIIVQDPVHTLKTGSGNLWLTHYVPVRINTYQEARRFLIQRDGEV